MNFCQKSRMRVNLLTVPVAITDFTISGERKHRKGAAEMSPFMG